MGGEGWLSTVTNKNVHACPFNEFSTSLTCQNVDVSDLTLYWGLRDISWTSTILNTMHTCPIEIKTIAKNAEINPYCVAPGNTQTHTPWDFIIGISAG